MLFIISTLIGVITLAVMYWLRVSANSSRENLGYMSEQWLAEYARASHS